MNDPLSSLNPQQRDAAEEINNHCAVISCPGSGKTKTVEAKVCHILRTSPMARVCCTTFSREGATEIKSRVEKALSNKTDSARITVSTFHALCFSTLKKHEMATPKLISQGERNYLITSAAISCGIQPKTDEFKAVADSIDSYATHSPQKLRQMPEFIHEVYREYKSRLKESGKRDFEDLLTETLELLERGTIQPEPFTHIICDEAQDSDSLMIRWLLVHAKSKAVITLMMDDDQTLYSFRNSLGVDVYRKLNQAIGARAILNATNYRSKSEVLAPAERLIGQNHNRIPKQIKPARGEGGKVEVHHFDNQTGTKQLISDLTRAVPEEWYILCRTNSDLEAVSNMLIELGIPFTGQEPDPLLERSDVQLLTTLLTTLQDGAGHGVDLAATCIATETQIAETCELLAVESLAQLIDCEPSFRNVKSLSQKQRDGLTELLTYSTAWANSLRENRFNRPIRLAANWIINNSTRDPSAIDLVKTLLLQTPGDIHQRLTTLNLKLSSTTNKAQPSGVKLMTAHSSKGLQRKKVIIWNCREGSFPSTPSDVEATREHIEEERRVLYVAMTRAEDELHIIYQSKKQNAKRFTKYEPSRFLFEMGFELGEALDIPL
jgi:superfamily I DNA/RNA helicase